MSINLTDELLAKTKKGKIASAKQVFLEGDQENLQQIGEKTHQLEDAIKDITVSGGASTATAVSYNNETSGMTAITAQGAIDELAAKNQKQDAAIGTKAEKSEVATELDKKYDKENIAQEFGDSEDKVVSQFALPFREIESPEFIKVIVDANGHLLFTINLDGEVDWGKGIPAPIKAKLQEIINQCQQDKTDIIEAINAAKKELSASIASLQEGKVDKEEGKSLIEDEVKECFRIIENEEFLKAIVDSDDKVLFGIYRTTGKPYYPLNEMYHVEQNEEFFAVWLDKANHVLFGIRRDGQIIGEIHTVNALKQVISQLQSDLASLQEKVGTIDTNLKELLDIFSMQENPEYLAVEKDAEGKILSSTNPDGSHYIHNAKSETIPTEFSCIEDPEKRMEIIIDANDKVISYRDKNGTLYEERINANHLELSEIGMSEFEKALKSHGFSDSKGDWTDSTYIHIPEPECAFANIEGELPTEKGKTTKGTINFYDMQGNYFKKYVEIDIHGRTSAGFNKKNYTIDFYNDSNYNDSFTIKFGRWVSLDSFYFQGWYTDAFRGIDIVAYKLYQQMVSTRGYEKDKPYKYVYNKDSVSYGTETNTNTSQNLGKNALCTPDGFPVILYLNGSFWGIYTVMLKKNRENFLMNKKDYSAIELDLDNGNIVNGIKDWSSFEIRNPKTLICMDGSKYDGDAPKELIDESSESYSGSNKDMKNSAITKRAIESLADAYNEVAAAISNSKTNEEIKAIIEAHYNVDFMIDYMIFSNLIENVDGWGGNWQWTTWNGIVWNPNPYDLNATFGLDPYGLFAKSPSTVFTSPSVTKYIYDYYKEDVKSRYASLRKDNIISTSNIIGLFKSWIERIGSDNYENEFKKWNATPSQRPSNINSEYWARNNYGINSYFYKYSASKTYKKNEYCFDSNNNIYFSLLDSNTGNSLDNEEAWKCMTFDKTKNYAIGDLSYMCNSICFEFKCLKPCIGIPPLSSLYDEKNGILGFYDSISRINKWVSERIQNLDNTLNYNI